MEMPDLRPVDPPRPRTKRFILVAVAAFILLAFAYAMLINIPEWR